MISRVMRKRSSGHALWDRALCKPGAARVLLLEPWSPHHCAMNCRQQAQAAEGKGQVKVFSG